MRRLAQAGAVALLVPVVLVGLLLCVTIFWIPVGLGGLATSTIAVVGLGASFRRGRPAAGVVVGLLWSFVAVGGAAIVALVTLTDLWQPQGRHALAQATAVGWWWASLSVVTFALTADSRRGGRSSVTAV